MKGPPLLTRLHPPHSAGLIRNGSSFGSWLSLPRSNISHGGCATIISPSVKTCIFETFRVNCDVVIQPSTKVGAVAALLRNDQGALLDGVAMKVPIASVLQGEVMAIRLACVMCDTLQLSQVEVEENNQGAIKMSVSEDAPP
ncbi:hypothetical protein LOK49_LG09G01962 [Camellia lanceoleosa]|uniref:Uncharacterized protein n=1 Tax=Camellia lanceoleosa TaxID=1840588 RepID=A0ACC0GJA2_9ERIC|nr:hypothetical protein LOK49_LG09G01962 [Camellia lanceoleosa]